MHYQLDKYDQQLQDGSQTKLSVTNTHTLIENKISIENNYSLLVNIKIIYKKYYRKS